MQSIGKMSPALTARVAGLFYLLMMLAGGLAVVARRGLIVAGNAAATAAGIAAHQSSFVVSFAGEILVVALYLVIVALFYTLFKPVNRNVALVAAFFGFMGCAIQASATAFMIAPLVVLGRAEYLNVFSANQLQSMAYMFLRLYSQTYGIALIFFGCFGLLIGYLILRSTFLPRFIGVLMMIAGLAWMTFLSPQFGAMYLRPYIMSAAIGELALMLWLLVKGVDVERWEASALSSA